MRRSKEASSAAARTEDPVNDLAAFREKKKKAFRHHDGWKLINPLTKKVKAWGGGEWLGEGSGGAEQHVC